MAAPAGLIVAWPSTVASIPAGWTRVAALNNNHPKASATAGTTGGNVAHTHTAGSHQHTDTHAHANATTAAGSGSVGVDVVGSGTTGVHDSTHTHPTTFAAASFSINADTGAASSSASEVLSTTTVIFLTSDGSTDIPSGAVMWWTTASAPTNWAYADGTATTPDLRNKYLLGATVGADGNTAVAAASHTHTYSHAHTATAHAGHARGVNSNAGGTTFTSGAVTPAIYTHGHTAGTLAAGSTTPGSAYGTDATASDAQTPEPPFYKLLPIKKTSADSAYPSGLIGWWVGGAAPSGWHICDGNGGTLNLNGGGYFIKGAATTGEIGTTGGAATHTHTDTHGHTVPAHTHTSTGTSGTPNATTTIGSAAYSAASSAHTHTGSTSGAISGSTTVGNTALALPANTSNDPAYSTTIYIQSTVAVANLVLSSADGVASASLVLSAPAALALDPADGIASATMLLSTPATLVLFPADGVASATLSLAATPAVAWLVLSSADGVATATLYLWTPAPPPDHDVTAPTDAEISDALSGRHGPVAMRFRVEHRTLGNEFIQDLDDAIILNVGEVLVDNTRAIVWTCTLRVRPQLLPATFDPDTDHFAIFADVFAGQYLGTGEWVPFQLGLYSMDQVREAPSANNQEAWDVQAADVGLLLFEKYTQESYTVAAGARFTDTVYALITGLGLRAQITDSALTLPVARTWPSNTPYGAIINALLKAINYFPAYADNEGIITSTPRLAPSTETADVAYTTAAEPRMIRPGFQRLRNRNLYPNRVTVVNRDANRAPFAVEGINDDQDSLVSTVVKGAVLSIEVDGSLVPSTAVAAAVAAYELQAAAGEAERATLSTHPDPRRGPRDFYQVTFEGAEVATLWRALGWRLALRTGTKMDHQIARASQVDVTTTTV